MTTATLASLLRCIQLPQWRARILGKLRGLLRDERQYCNQLLCPVRHPTALRDDPLYRRWYCDGHRPERGSER